MRVWLLQHDDGLRAVLARGLSSLFDIDVTASFRDGASTLAALARGADFDVALVDLVLPDLPGERVIGALTSARPSAAVIALTARAEDDAVFGALAAGALGFLLEDVTLRGLADALRLASMGGAPFTPSIGRRVACRFRRSTTPAPEVRLTNREHQVLEQLCSGAPYREVARLLGIAEGTVQTYVKSLYEKLGVCSKAEAVRMAYESALVAPRQPAF